MTWIHSKSAMTHPGLAPGLSMCPSRSPSARFLPCAAALVQEGMVWSCLSGPGGSPCRSMGNLTQQHCITPHPRTLGQRHELEPPQCSGSIPCSCTWDAAITAISQPSARKLLHMEPTPAWLQRRLPRDEMHGLRGCGVTSSQAIPQHNKRNGGQHGDCRSPRASQGTDPSPSPATTDPFSG